MSIYTFIIQSWGKLSLQYESAVAQAWCLQLDVLTQISSFCEWVSSFHQWLSAYASDPERYLQRNIDKQFVNFNDKRFVNFNFLTWVIKKLVKKEKLT